MITEDYCSYEVAKLLEEKGFDEKTLSYYEDNVLCHGDWFEWNRSPLGHIAAPTHQMAMKWLRKKGIFIEISIIITNEDKVYYHASCGTVANCWKIISEWNASYEEVVENALKYSLENLI